MRDTVTAHIFCSVDGVSARSTECPNPPPLFQLYAVGKTEGERSRSVPV